jgi:exodeoxyribonuclease VII large subunit
MNRLKNATTLASNRSNSRNIAADTSSISVSQLNRQVKSMLENSFLNIRVQGEISNFAKPSSGHWYFTLKDAKAQIRCAMFKGNNSHIKLIPLEGDEVIVQARVSLYEGRGDYQLICESMEEAGSGRLQLAFEQLKAKLHKQGLFDSQYKKDIPRLAKHLAVITSSNGAAIHDVLSVLKRRFPGLPVTIYPSQVQGDQAADTIITALTQVQEHKVCDLILITRGGGSLEDLWPFNEERLAKAVFNCKIPIISAVGHEVDFSICDLVADYRAATPSAAAELISPDQDNLRIQIDRLQLRLVNQIKSQIQNKRNLCTSASAKLRSPKQQLRLQNLQLAALKNRLMQPINKSLNIHRQTVQIMQHKLLTSSPELKIDNYKSKLEHLKNRCSQLAQLNVQNNKLLLKPTVATLNSLSPLATLERGYSITRSKGNQVIIDSNQVAIGDSISSDFYQGKIESTVTKITTNKSKKN